MEQRKLPNETLIIVLGIFGFICCCFAGIGAIPAGIGYFLATKSEKIYAENPDQYDNLSQIKTGKIIALIALIISVLMLVRFIYVISTSDWDSIMEQSREMMEEWGIEE
ncbi:MAG: CCC motif membrane protein [Flavobacteriaceae bacterium]